MKVLTLLIIAGIWTPSCPVRRDITWQTQCSPYSSTHTAVGNIWFDVNTSDLLRYIDAEPTYIFGHTPQIEFQSKTGAKFIMTYKDEGVYIDRFTILPNDVYVGSFETDYVDEIAGKINTFISRHGDVFRGSSCPIRKDITWKTQCTPSATKGPMLANGKTIKLLNCIDAKSVYAFKYFPSIAIKSNSGLDFLISYEDGGVYLDRFNALPKKVYVGSFETDYIDEIAGKINEIINE